MSTYRGTAESSPFVACGTDGATWRRRLRRAIPGLAALMLTLGAPPVAAQEWSAALRVRAGAMDGPGSLGNVFKVRMGRNGEILVAQPSVPTISVFDSTGRYLRDVGRAGRGPGEFGALGGLGWTGDTLWVMDVAQARLHLFDRDLSFARTITPTISGLPRGVARVLPGPLLANGSILGIPLIFGPADFHPLILLAEDGSIRRSLPPLAYRGHTVAVTGNGEAIGEITNPWSDSHLWTPAADGRSIIIVHRPVAEHEDQGRLRILRLGLDGDTIVNREFVYRPRPLRDAERDRAYRELAERLARNPRLASPVAQVERDVRTSLPAPRFYPAVTEVLAGDDGTIWLRRETPAAGREEWQVFGDQGDILGRIRLPEELQVHGADLEKVWGVTRNELDVSFVEVYQVNRQGVP